MTVDETLLEVLSELAECGRARSTIQKDLQDLTEDRPAWSKWLETASEVLQESYASAMDIGPLASERMYGEETVKAKSVHRLMKRFMVDVGL
jgi:hypothetical protein